MMGLANFKPSVTTMDNITSSGDFALIKTSELRTSLINTYNTYSFTEELQRLLSEFVNMYLTPFLMNNVSFSDFSSIENDYRSNPLLENIVMILIL